MAVYEVKLLQDERKTYRTFVAARSDFLANVYGREIATECGLTFVEAIKQYKQTLSSHVDQQIASTTDIEDGLALVLFLTSLIHASLWEGIADQAKESKQQEARDRNKGKRSKLWT